MSQTDIESAKLDLAEILMNLTGANPSDKQAYAEISSNAEGWLEDFMEYWDQRGEWEVKS